MGSDKRQNTNCGAKRFDMTYGVVWCRYDMKPGCVKCSCVICGAARLAEEAEGKQIQRRNEEYFRKY